MWIVADVAKHRTVAAEHQSLLSGYHHYLLNNPLAELADKTPLEAAQTNEGRILLEEWIAQGNFSGPPKMKEATKVGLRTFLRTALKLDEPLSKYNLAFLKHESRRGTNPGINGGLVIDSYGDWSDSDCVRAVKTAMAERQSIDRVHEHGGSHLSFAVSNGFVKCAKFILKQGANVDQLVNIGATALIVAATKGQYQCTKLLIKHKAAIDHVTVHGESALMQASMKGYMKVVKLLLKHGAQVNRVNSDGGSAIAMAAMVGQVDILRVLVDRGGNTRDGFSFAARSGQAESLKTLLELGAAVDEELSWGPRGMTALLTVAALGAIDCVTLLLKQGADVHKTNIHGDTALLLAAASHIGDGEETKRKRKKMVDEDDGIHEDTKALFNAADSNQKSVIACIQALIEYGADVNYAQPNEGKTALMNAITAKRADTAHVLLKQGARINQANDQGATPLFMAAGIGHLESLQLLLDFGADPYYATHAGITALDNAKRRRNFQCVKVLSSALEWSGPLRLNASSSSSSWWMLTVLFFMVVLCCMYRNEVAVWWRGQARDRQGRPRRQNRRNRRHQRPNQRQQQQQQHAVAAAAVVEDPEWWKAVHKDHRDPLDNLTQEERPEYICKVTHEIMRDPAMLVETGNTYQYDALHRWVVVDGQRMDPGTNVSFSNVAIARNKALQRQIREWCEKVVADLIRGKNNREHSVQLQLQATVDSTQESQWAADAAHIFVDDSNLMAGAQGNPSLNLRNLITSVEGRRNIKERIVIGSTGATGERSPHWEIWERAQYQLGIGVRDPNTGREVFVDEALQVQMARTAASVYRPGRVLVLITGDGNRNDGRVRFPEIVEIALRHGWCVELYSWASSTHSVYKEFDREYVGFFKLHFLDALVCSR
jgi:ankyrin repeat protein